MVDNLIFIHEFLTPKLGKILKDKRIEKYYSVNSVTDFLGISADVLRNYETGRRSPRINVLYALCELYEINIGEVIKASLKWRIWEKNMKKSIKTTDLIKIWENEEKHWDVKVFVL